MEDMRYLEDSGHAFLAEAPLPVEMAAWDANAIDLGLPEQVLMENAARAATAELRRRTGAFQGKVVLLLAGGGNNGGDVFCMARHLLDEGALPILVHTRPREGYAGAAGFWLSTAERLGVPTYHSDEWEAGEVWLEFNGREEDFSKQPDIIVDGLLGTGFHGTLRERELRLVRKINAMDAGFVFAVDVPSGLDAATGKACPDAVRADITVTFQSPKPGLLLPSAVEYTGQTVVVPIGIPKEARKKASLQTIVMPFQKRADGGFTLARTAAEAAEAGAWEHVPAVYGEPLPAHKGRAGRVVVIGGCAEYTGAPCLAAHAALRAGAGLVSLVAPESVVNTARVIQPALVFKPLYTEDGIPVKTWCEASVQTVIDAVKGADAVVVGPGIGNTAGELIGKLLAYKARPRFVVDADAINALASSPERLGFLRSDDIVTPHPGEAGRLLGISSRDVQADRFEAVSRLSSLARAVWVLKGEGTLIASPDRATIISPWSVPYLAVAGSGDVLAGMAGAYLAQGCSSEGAAMRAVWIHALAGMSLRDRFPCRGCTPMDIADAVPSAAAFFLSEG